jgi:outer membrane protein assembly factor BamD
MIGLPSTALRLGVLLTLAIAVSLSSCRSNREVAATSPEVIYDRAKRSLQARDYNNAIRTYEALTSRFPFTDQARQARLDLIYAYYRADEKESATDAVEQFIRENPTHPRIDYAWYIRGLIDFEKESNALERLFRVDRAARPPATARQSFASLRTVVERFPKSEYAHDARQRMIYLRNLLAEYEVRVARYYLSRGAFVAASQRAKSTIEQYDGAPAVQGALEVLIAAYDRLGLKDLATSARQVYASNFKNSVAQLSPAARKPWWRFW